LLTIERANQAEGRELTSSDHSQVERRGVHLVLDRDALGVDESVERLLDELREVIREMTMRRSLQVVVDGVCRKSYKVRPQSAEGQATRRKLFRLTLRHSTVELPRKIVGRKSAFACGEKLE
jgi:hypothetical protein